jgi:hypothetical protein
MAVDLLKQLISEIQEDVDSSSYDPDEFYDEAIEHLSIYGFERLHEVVHEAHPEDPYDIEEPHLEVVTKFTTGEEEIDVRFILQDCTGDYEVPYIETVDGMYENLTDLD